MISISKIEIDISFTGTASMGVVFAIEEFSGFEILNSNKLIFKSYIYLFSLNGLLLVQRDFQYIFTLLLLD